MHLYKDELEIHTTNKKVSTQVYTFRERQKFSDHMTFHSEASIRARAGGKQVSSVGCDFTCMSNDVIYF